MRKERGPRWLSTRQNAPGAAPGTALTGTVTLPGDPAGAWLEGERRGVAVYAPGGYHWVPAAEDEILVLKAGENGEQPCAVGVPAGAKGLLPGQVLIQTGKSAIKLDPEGTVELTGIFRVNGTTVGPIPTVEED